MKLLIWCVQLADDADNYLPIEEEQPSADGPQQPLVEEQQESLDKDLFPAKGKPYSARSPAGETRFLRSETLQPPDKDLFPAIGEPSSARSPAEEAHFLPSLPSITSETNL